MTMNYSMNNVYHIWQRLSDSMRVYRGTVEALDSLHASTAARSAFGAGQYIVRATKFGRIENAYA